MFGQNSLLALLFSLALGACNAASETAGMPRTARFDAPAQRSARVPSAMDTEGAVEGQLTYGAPYQLPGQTTWVSSFTVTQSRSFFRDPDPFSAGGLASEFYDDGAVDRRRLRSTPIGWHNAVFVDRSSGEEWPLLDERGYLSKWWMLLEAEPENWRDDELFRPASLGLVFAATVVDSNGDGRLDDRDASVAVLTDGSGRGGRPVTPPHTQISSVGYLAEEDVLTFQLRVDEDGDGKFETSDPVRLFTLSADQSQGVAQPWHGALTTEALRQLYR